MAEIIHEFSVMVEPERVFEAFSTPTGLDKWWTKTSAGCSSSGCPED
jgi:uncharacterized protein YndB with AHSA1/START domain